MKVINEKGKLFGIVNVVDLLVLVLIIGSIGAVAWSVFGDSVRDIAAPTVTMTATFRVRGAMPYLVEELERNDQTNKKLVSGNSYTSAEIISVEFEDYYVQATTSEGEIVNSLDPVKKDILLTVETEVAKNTPTPTIGTQEVRAGREFIFKTNDFETISIVDSVKFDD